MWVRADARAAFDFSLYSLCLHALHLRYQQIDGFIRLGCISSNSERKSCAIVSLLLIVYVQPFFASIKFQIFVEFLWKVFFFFLIFRLPIFFLFNFLYSYWFTWEAIYYYLFCYFIALHSLSRALACILLWFKESLKDCKLRIVRKPFRFLGQGQKKYWIFEKIPQRF